MAYINGVFLIKDFGVEVGAGAIAGYSSVQKVGRCTTVTTAETDVWFVGTPYPWPTTAASVRVKAGGSASDAAGQSGARKVMVVGLDASWSVAQEELTLAGASQSLPTVTQFIRINSVFVSETGTYTGANVGNVTIETTTAVTLAALPAGLGISNLSMYTVPAGYTAYLLDARVIGDSSKITTLRLYQRRNANVTAAPVSAKILVQDWPGISSPAVYAWQNPPSFPEKTDLWFTASLTAGTGTVAVSYDLFLKST